MIRGRSKRQPKEERADPLYRYIIQRQDAMELTDEEAGKQWLGMAGKTFGNRRNFNSFTVKELRRIIRHTQATDAEIIKLLGVNR